MGLHKIGWSHNGCLHIREIENLIVAEPTRLHVPAILSWHQSPRELATLGGWSSSSNKGVVALGSKEWRQVGKSNRALPWTSLYLCWSREVLPILRETISVNPSSQSYLGACFLLPLPIKMNINHHTPETCVKLNLLSLKLFLLGALPHQQYKWWI